MRTKDDKKAALIRAEAMKMIVEEGFDGFSMKKLARVTDLSPATIYIYFKDRDDLIYQVCVEQNELMIAATFKDFDPEAPFAAGLERQWLNRAKYCLKYPERMKFLEQSRHSPVYEEVSKFVYPRFKQEMGTFMKRAVAKGEVADVPVEVYWAIAFAPLYSLVKFHYEGQSIGGLKFKFSKKIMMETLALVLKALKP